MKKTVILCILVAALFLVSCTTIENPVKSECISPNKIIGTKCCIDSNADNMCDANKVNEKTIEPQGYSKDIPEEKVSFSQKSGVNLREDMLEKNQPSEWFMQNYEEVCSNLTFGEHHNRCYQNVAMLTKNLSVCSKIPDSTYDSNLDECYGTVGYATENVTLCKTISQRTFHNECIWGVAIKTKNVSLCKELKTFVWQDACYSMLGPLTKDITLCEMPQLKTYRIGCYQRFAHTTQNPSICDNIGKEDHLYVNACKELSMKREAWRLSCDNIYSNFARQSCISGWEERTKNFVEKVNETLCNELPNDLHEKDWCLQTIAYVTANDSYCDKIKVDSDKNFCIRISMAKKLNLSKCFDLNIVSDKQLCIAEHAIYTKNMSTCNLLLNTSDAKTMARRDECVKYIGIATNNASLCKEATNREDRVRCVNHIARVTHDKDVCETIFDEKKGNMEFVGARDQCIAGIYLLQDDWDYDCLWAPDSAIAYACYYAKAEGVRLGRKE